MLARIGISPGFLQQYCTYAALPKRRIPGKALAKSQFVAAEAAIL
jgi:hypothetical protein